MKCTIKPATWRICALNNNEQADRHRTSLWAGANSFEHRVENSVLTLSEGSRDILELREFYELLLSTSLLGKGYENVQQ